MAEWTQFQTHYYSENMVAPGIEPGTSVSVARNLDHRGGHSSATPCILFVLVYFQNVYVVIHRKQYFYNVISQIQTESMQCAPLEGNQNSPGGVEMQVSKVARSHMYIQLLSTFGAMHGIIRTTIR